MTYSIDTFMLPIRFKFSAVMTWEKGLYKHREANPSRGENPQVKSWSTRMGVGHRASNPIPEKQILL
jgi:hypothetical protein